MKNIFTVIISLFMLMLSSSVFAEGEELTVKANQHAYFPGGQSALATWLSENVKYPQECIDKKVDGEVIVSLLRETARSLESVWSSRLIQSLMLRLKEWWGVCQTGWLLR